MFKIKLKVLGLRFRYCTKRRDDYLMEAERQLILGNRSKYQEYMRRARRYISRIRNITVKAEEIIYGLKGLA